MNFDWSPRGPLSHFVRLQRVATIVVAVLVVTFLVNLIPNYFGDSEFIRAIKLFLLAGVCYKVYEFLRELFYRHMFSNALSSLALGFGLKMDSILLAVTTHAKANSVWKLADILSLVYHGVDCFSSGASRMSYVVHVGCRIMSSLGKDEDAAAVVKKWFRGQESMRSQDSSESWYIPFVSDYLLGYSDKESSAKLRDFNQRMLAIRSFSGMVKLAKEFYKWCTESTAMRDRYEKYLSDVTVFLTNKPVNFVEAVRKELRDLYAEGKLLREVMANASSDLKKTIPAAFLSTYTEFDRYFDEVKSQLDDWGPRVSPVTVVLTGPAGTGKSELARIIQNWAVCVACKDKNFEAVKHRIYPYCKNANARCDGLTGNHEVFFMDDLLQVTNVIEKSAEAMLFCRAASKDTYLPDVARMSEKRSAAFRFSFVVATTNQELHSTSPMGIEDPNAVLRRIDYLISLPTLTKKVMSPTIDDFPEVFVQARRGIECDEIWDIRKLFVEIQKSYDENSRAYNESGALTDSNNEIIRKWMETPPMPAPVMVPGSGVLDIEDDDVKLNPQMERTLREEFQAKSDARQAKARVSGVMTGKFVRWAKVGDDLKVMYPYVPIDLTWVEALTSHNINMSKEGFLWKGVQWYEYRGVEEMDSAAKFCSRQTVVVDWNDLTLKQKLFYERNTYDADLSVETASFAMNIAVGLATGLLFYGSVHIWAYMATWTLVGAAERWFSIDMHPRQRDGDTSRDRKFVIAFMLLILLIVWYLSKRRREGVEVKFVDDLQTESWWSKGSSSKGRPIEDDDRAIVLLPYRKLACTQEECDMLNRAVVWHVTMDARVYDSAEAESFEVVNRKAPVRKPMATESFETLGRRAPSRKPVIMVGENLAEIREDEYDLVVNAKRRFEAACAVQKLDPMDAESSVVLSRVRSTFEEMVKEQGHDPALARHWYQPLDLVDKAVNASCLSNVDVPMKSEVATDKAANSVMTKVNANLGYVCIDDGTGYVYRTNCLGIAGYNVLINQHTLLTGGDPNKTQLMLWRPNVRVYVLLKECSIIKLPNDKCIVHNPKFGMYRSILEHFPRTIDLPTTNSEVLSPVLFVKRDHADLESDGRALLMSQRIPTYRYVTAHREQVRGDVATNIWIRGMYEFPCETSAGDCMGIYYSLNVHHSHKIMALHAASTGPGVAIGTPALYEELVAAIIPDNAAVRGDDVLFAQSGIKFVDDETSANLCEKIPMGFLFLGVSAERSHMGSRSKFTATPLQEYVTPTTRPPHMSIWYRDGVRVNPSDYFFNKKVESHYVDNRLIEKAIEGEEYVIPKAAPQFKHSFLSMLEVLNGVDGTMSKPIRIETSAGFRLRKMCAGRGKIPYVRKEVRKDGSFTIIPSSQCVKENEEHLRLLETEATFQVFADAQKDERYPLDKEDKFRVVSPDDVRDFFMFKMLYGPFLEALRRFRPFGNSQVGIDATGPDFDLLVKYMKEYGDNAMEMDAKAWDFTLPYEVKHAFYILADRWCEIWFPGEDPVWALRRRFFRHKYLTHYHIIGRLVYGRIGGQCSGVAGTAEENGLSNRVISRVCFDGLDGRDFDSHVRAAYYGDDFWCVVADASGFNQVTFTRYCKEHLGMEWTTADKVVADKPYVPLIGASFISRRVQQLQEGVDVYVGVMDEDSVKEIPLWVRSLDPSQNIVMFRQNCEASLREMFFHGKDKFSVWRGVLNRVLVKHGALPVLLEYGDLLRDYCDKV